MKCLLEDFVKTKVHCVRAEEVCVSNITYLAQGHRESLLQRVVGKLTVPLQIWLENMSQISVVSVFNYVGLT